MNPDEWTPPNPRHPPPKADEPPLHAAARTGNDDRVRSLVDGGAEVDDLFDIALDPGVHTLATPLMVAAGSGDGATADTVALLLELGASIELITDGVTALWFACRGLGWNYRPGGDAARLQLLLDAGADPLVTQPHWSGEIGKSALAAAAETGDPERVRLLLDAGADPAPTGVAGVWCVPLSEALDADSADCVRLLIDAGAPLTVELPPPRDVEYLIAKARSPEVLELLLMAGADPHVRPGHLELVHHLLREGGPLPQQIAMLELLIDAGVDITAPGANHLSDAALSPDPVAVEALLAVGVDPRSGRSALSCVCFNYCDERDDDIERTIDLLVEAGADPNDRDAAGFGPMHTALSPNTFERDYQESDGFNAAAVVALIRHGASVDITFPDTGYGPLHMAALGGSDIAVEALLDAGADPRLRGLDGKTALDLARALLADIKDLPPPERRDDGRLLNDEDRDPTRVAHCIDLLSGRRRRR